MIVGFILLVVVLVPRMAISKHQRPSEVSSIPPAASPSSRAETNFWARPEMRDITILMQEASGSVSNESAAQPSRTR